MSLWHESAGELLLLVSLDNEVGLGGGSAGGHAWTISPARLEYGRLMPSSSAWSRMYMSSGHTMLNSPSGGDQLGVVRGHGGDPPNSDRPAFWRAENPTLPFPWLRGGRRWPRLLPWRREQREEMASGVQLSQYCRAGGRVGWWILSWHVAVRQWMAYHFRVSCAVCWQFSSQSKVWDDGMQSTKLFVLVIIFQIRLMWPHRNMWSFNHPK